MQGGYPETLKSEEFKRMNVKNHLVGSNFKSIKAAYDKAELLEYNTLILSAQLTGETKDVAGLMEGIIDSEFSHQVPLKTPACLIFGGETTVKVTGNGLGGRNQDLALRMAQKIAGKQDILFISLGTDGEDGPTDAAGGAVDGLIMTRSDKDAREKINAFINKYDSYHYLEQKGGLIKTGSTGTNVNDLILILIKPSSGN
jgi:glycerate-2-kinase